MIVCSQDAKIAVLEKTSAESEKKIAEARYSDCLYYRFKRNDFWIWIKHILNLKLSSQ